MFGLSNGCTWTAKDSLKRVTYKKYYAFKDYFGNSAKNEGEV